MEITRHFTATVYVVHGGKVLLHRHRKLNLLLPPGGHIERDELPEEAALREVKEESGLDVDLWQAPAAVAAVPMKDARVLEQPAAILLEQINPHHQHIDLIFFARARTDEIDQKLRIEQQLEWYNRERLNTAEMPENVRLMAWRALDLLGTE